LVFHEARAKIGIVNAASPTTITFEDYLELEAKEGAAKHEWCDGVVYAMSRGTPEHGRLTAAMIGALRVALKGQCDTYASDTMLYVEAARLATYADASLVCGPLETKKVVKNGRSLGEAVTNPTIIVEVLSEATERYDRDGKFQAYKTLTSLREYVLVAQDDRRIEVYRRDEGGRWSVDVAEAGGRVEVHGAPISVDDVYG
jgi:Uma2 family endonuclease